MPGPISSSIGPIAILAALVVSAASVDLRTNKAYANDCVAAPNASAPQGQHWYYRIDRANHRKCWYLHATLPLPHRAAVKRAEHRDTSTADNVPTLPSVEDDAPGSAHITTLAVKPQLAPFISTTAEELSQQSAQDETDPPSIPRESGARTLRSDGHTEVSDDPDGTAASGESSGTAGIAGALRLIFLLLGPALAIAGLLVHIIIKILGERRFQIPETARIGRQFLDERFGRQAQAERRDDRRRLGFADPRSWEHFPARPHGNKEFPPVSTRRSATRSQNIAAAAAETPKRDVKGIERALRVIKQARQHESA